jgi:hypothetical protein
MMLLANKEAVMTVLDALNFAASIQTSKTVANSVCWRF